MIDPESDERNIVDLLYFPTGGGKTEAYLGLIAFIIAYRRLTSDSDYEKDGGVTVFLRYTLRLLTTQQRDRLLKLIVAMEDLRERSEKNGKAEFGTTPISIGYWVGGSVTPNKFDEYEKDEYSRKEFVRKVTKQIIRCPYCGKLIGRENYDINALVVAMLRLQTETMAGNKGASNILSISDEELGKIKDQILERISIVAPMAYESASDDIDAFISTWKEIAKDENLYYFVTNTENNKRLLSYYGQPITGKEKPTLNSMRDVEQSSTVYLYEEGGAL